MAGQLLLAVESPDDLHVLKAILKRHQFQPEFEIRDEGGIESLLARVPIHLKAGTDIERMGIVVNADVDIQSRWHEIKRTLIRARYGNVPSDPDPAGTVIDQEDLPRVGIWIMPNNVLPGMLEDYLCFLVPAGDALLDRARRCVDEIPAEERRFIHAHVTKALIHTWLAWQEKPGTPMGQAITKRYFDADGPHMTQLLAWLTRLFA